jgi:hypothetical protein
MVIVSNRNLIFKRRRRFFTCRSRLISFSSVVTALFYHSHCLILLDFILPLCLCIRVEGPNEMAVLRWNSQHGSVFVDGSHLKVRAMWQLD